MLRTSRVRLVIRLVAVIFACPPVLAVAQIGVKGWPSYCGNAQHTGIAPVASQVAKRIRWSTPVDLNPQYSGNSLLTHYGTALVTPKNTVVVTVKTGANDGFQMEGHRASDGALLWTQVTDYSLPAHNWVPSCGATLLKGDKVAYPGAGGTIYIRDNCDSGFATVTQYCFYGLSGYQSNKAAMDAAIQICTPITADGQGNLFFGYVAAGNPLNVSAGIAEITSSGTGIWKDAATAAGNANASRPIYNCAPAISNDGTEVYMSFTGNVLAGMSVADLTNLHSVVPLDPKTGNDASFFDDGTSSPTVAPDGDVFYGGFDNPFSYTHLRGYLYHFTHDLTQKSYTGSFGWDDTCSIVPAATVPSYHGSSSYLLFTKYNNYLEGGGDGTNKIAILDPNDFQFDTIDQTNTMKEVLTTLGPTPDLRGGFVEWCINSGAIDVFRKGVVANSEDGKCYFWNLTNNTLENTQVLTSGIGEAYTPTIIGPDGTQYAINNAKLFALGDDTVLPSSVLIDRGTVSSGNTFELSYDDKYSYVLAASTQTSLNDYPLQVVVTSTSFDKLNSGSGSLVFEVKMSQIVGNLTQRIEFYNYATGQYETVDTRTGSNAMSHTTVTVASNPSRFVDQNSNQIRARLSLRSNVFPVVRKLTGVFNLMKWTVNP